MVAETYFSRPVRASFRAIDNEAVEVPDCDVEDGIGHVDDIDTHILDIENEALAEALAEAQAEEDEPVEESFFGMDPETEEELHRKAQAEQERFHLSPAHYLTE
jgi:hypothetical protein